MWAGRTEREKERVRAGEQAGGAWGGVGGAAYSPIALFTPLPPLPFSLSLHIRASPMPQNAGEDEWQTVPSRRAAATPPSGGALAREAASTPAPTPTPSRARHTSASAGRKGPAKAAPPAGPGDRASPIHPATPAASSPEGAGGRSGAAAVRAPGIGPKAGKKAGKPPTVAQVRRQGRWVGRARGRRPCPSTTPPGVGGGPHPPSPPPLTSSSRLFSRLSFNPGLLPPGRGRPRRLHRGRVR